MPEDWRIEHYQSLFERYKDESTRYQAMLFHSWETIRMQQKGLKRQAKKIKRLQAELKSLVASQLDLLHAWGGREINRRR